MGSGLFQRYELDPNSSRPADASLAAQLFQLSMGSLADYLFNHDSRFAEISLTKLFSRNAGRFGFTNAFVAEADDESFGLLVAYPGKKLSSLDLQTLHHLFSALGLPRVFDFLRIGISLPGGKEAEADEYYQKSAVKPLALAMGIHRTCGGCRCQAQTLTVYNSRQ